MKKPGNTRLFGNNPGLSAAVRALLQEPEQASREGVQLAWRQVRQAWPPVQALPVQRALLAQGPRASQPVREQQAVRVWPGRVPAWAAACFQPWPWLAGR